MEQSAAGTWPRAKTTDHHPLPLAPPTFHPKKVLGPMKVGDSSNPTPHIITKAPKYINLLNEARNMQTDNDNVNGMTN
jgi:hypothetical protein